MIDVAFCNDCDCMVWNDYQRMHGLLDELGLPAGDSFWLFDPLNDSDMSLFRNEVGHKARNHDRVLEQIRDGRIDVLHGIGHFGQTPDDYAYPDRDEIRRAFDYLADQGCRVRVYVCHGNLKHVHNIPASPATRRYQRGDLPYSRHHILDIVQDYGIEYFWISELRRDLNLPFRLMHPAPMPSGETIQAFVRYGQWGVGSHDIPALLDPELLARARAMGQNLVLFSHWGMKGLHSPTPDKPLLHSGVVAALAGLARLQAEGTVRVRRLGDLLDAEAAKSLAQEADRMSGLLSAGGGPAAHGSGADYARLVAEIGLAGGTAVDASSSGGDLAVALTPSFDQVICLDEDEQALTRAQYLAGCLSLSGLSVSRGGLAETPVQPESVDAVFLRARSLQADRDVLARAWSMLRPGRAVCVFVDAALRPEGVRGVCEAAGFRTFEWQDAPSGEREVDPRQAFLGALPRFFATR